MKFRQFFLAFTLSITGLAVSSQTINPGGGITTPGGPVISHTINDDGYAHVPLQFGFPYFGKLFTNSWMFDNGIVAFMDPVGTQANQYWNAEQFSQGMQPRFSYMIAPLWSDLKPVASTTYTTQGNQQSMTYTWTNLAEYYNPTNLNTFSLQIKPSGFIGVDYTNINLTQSNVSVGLTGDLGQGQYVQHFWAPAGTHIGLGSIPNWNITDTGVDQCAVDPLSSPTCSGYTDAMCAADSLYSSTCSGYETAYFSQQCSLDVFYNTSCPGYAAAYLSQQCSSNPLYSPTCPDYQQAYFIQQCSADPLYNNQCEGYADAYYVQQCTSDPLYDSGCTGYDVAYLSQQCSLNTLYDSTCPGYEQAYFNHQCSLDALYNNKCSGYSEAYAKKNIITAETISPQESVIPATSAVVETAVVTEELQQTIVSPADFTSAVQLLLPTASLTLTTTAKAETSNATSPSASQSATTTSSTSSSEKKDAPKTTRQQLAQRRLEAARAKAVEQAPEMVSQMASATTMEQQVETQAVVLSAMGFVPGFDAYGAAFIPDGIAYKPFTIYNNQKNVDNANMLRGLSRASDRLHNALVDSQYNKN